MLKTMSATNATPLRVVIVGMDTHFSGALDKARLELTREMPGLHLALHARLRMERRSRRARAMPRRHRARATSSSPACCSWRIISRRSSQTSRRGATAATRWSARCRPRRSCASPASVASRWTARAAGAINLLKKLRGAKKPGAEGGARQMAMLRKLPRILRLIPGTAQDVRAYFLTLQYWLGGSQQNLANMVRFLVGRYADGPRPQPARRREGRAADRLPRRRRLPSPPEGPRRRQGRSVAEKRGQDRRHGRRAGDALLPAGRQHRALRRRHRRARGARGCASSPPSRPA